MANVDVFVGNDTLIDADVYQLWLNGYTSKLKHNLFNLVNVWNSLPQVVVDADSVNSF